MSGSRGLLQGGSGSGNGTVITTGSPASGNLAKFSGATSITNGDLAGDVTTAGTLTVTITDAAVTYAKIQDTSAASVLIGRGSASGAGDVQEITLGSGLSMSGTTLSATSSGLPSLNDGTIWIGNATNVATARTLSGDVTVTDTGVTAIGAGKVTPAMISFSGAMAKKSGNQTGANYTTFTAVAFDAESYDNGGWHDNVTNNTRLTVPSGVTFVIVTAAMYVQNVAANAVAYAVIRKNGSFNYDGAAGAIYLTPNNGGGTNERLVNVKTGAVPVTAGDYFELFYLEVTDTSVDIIAANTNFSIRAVA